MELTDSLTALFIETAPSLQGSARRIFLARTVQELGPGGQRCAERALGWNRGTIRTGTPALKSGCTCLDAFSARGRTRAAVHWPHWLSDIHAIVDSQSQTAPRCRTTRLYPRVRAAAVRRQLIAHQGSTDDELPTVQTITTKRNALGSFPQKGAKSPPQKTFQQPRRSSPR
jgi:hypothetical protein